MSAFGDLDAALENLWIREGSQDDALPKNVRRHGRLGFVEVASGHCSAKAMERHPKSVATIKTWAQANGFDAAIWTALASDFHALEQGRRAVFGCSRHPLSRNPRCAKPRQPPSVTSGLRRARSICPFELRSMPAGRKGMNRPCRGAERADGPQFISQGDRTYPDGLIRRLGADAPKTISRHRRVQIALRADDSLPLLEGNARRDNPKGLRSGGGMARCRALRDQRLSFPAGTTMPRHPVTWHTTDCESSSSHYRDA